MANEINEIERFCIDAYLYDHKNLERAYVLSRKNPTESKYVLKMASRWINSDRVQEYIKSRTQQQFIKDSPVIGSPSDEGTPNYRSKDHIIDEMVAQLPYLQPKERANVLMKVAELQQMQKAQEPTAEDRRIHFYLPLSCDRCPLYINHKRNEKPFV